MSDALLVLNAGSSSFKFAVFPIDGNGVNASSAMQGEVSGIGGSTRFKLRRRGGRSSEETWDEGQLNSLDHKGAFDLIRTMVARQAEDLKIIAVGHRVVHGGNKRVAAAKVTPRLLEELESYYSLAPHHQPHNLGAIKTLVEETPELPQVACFDTAFHSQQSDTARRLPLSEEYEKRGLLRYGFHGLSYEFVSEALWGRYDGRLPPKVVIAHLGSGASLCAVKDGKSVATTMGFSTLDGVMMGTRCGAIDPGVLLYLMREDGLGERELEDLLYNRSGLLGVSGLSADMRVLLESETPEARRAVELFCHSVSRHLGSMIMMLGGIDALVFTGGVGQNAVLVREQISKSLEWLGLELDHAANGAGKETITTKQSKVTGWIIPTDEEQMIARHTFQCVRRR